MSYSVNLLIKLTASNFGVPTSGGISSLLFLGIICFVVMASEGAILDWGGLYLEEFIDTPEYLLGAGFRGFSVAMTLARFFRDFLSNKLRSERLLSLGTFMAFLDYLGVLNLI